MIKRRIWLFVAGGVLLSAAAVFLIRRTDIRFATVREQPAADSLLNIPLEQTVLARQEFVQAYYRTADRRHAGALYERFLPRIGANGLREGIQTVLPACHDEGHDLGKLIFSKLRDVGASLESCGAACKSGCMHGVLMQFFTDGKPMNASSHQHSQLTAGEIAGQIPTFCDSPAMTLRYSPGDCAHGVGHAAMFLSRYDIPAGIDLCERFSSYALRYYCATGAYMEYRITKSPADYPVHGGLYPCTSSPYPAACFRYVMTNTIQRHFAGGGNIQMLQQQCATLSGKYRLGCFHGIGSALEPNVLRGFIPVGRACGFGSRDDQTVCIDGAMERLGKFEPTIAAARCEALNDWRRGVCQAAASRKMYDMTKSFALYQR